jgi:hypothetical protein
MSAIPFEYAFMSDFNALSPCCCPAAECPQPVFEYQYRDSVSCKGGFSPWLKNDSTPNGFDLTQPGKLVPLYRTQTESTKIEKAGTLAETWQYSSGGVVSDTFVFNATVAYDFTTSQQSTYDKKLEEWEAGSQPFGACPPESTIMAAQATASGVSIGAEDENGNVVVTLSTPEVRPEDPGNPGEKAGFYQFRVDGFTYTSGNEFEVTMAADDDTCHEFQVRHVCGGNGKWSEPKVFSVVANPCCGKASPLPRCSLTFTTGNIQWDKTQEYVSDEGNGTWSTSYSGTGPSSSDSGSFSACTGTEPDNVPLGLSSFQFRPAIDWLLNSSEGYETSTTYTQDERKIVESSTRSDSSSYTPDPLNDPPGWYLASGSDAGTAKVTETLAYSDDRNQGKSSISGMFGELRGQVQRVNDSYGWGMTVFGNWWWGESYNGYARAVGVYPETDGFTYEGQLRVHLRQFRYRWEVPVSHDGDFYRVHWRIGRFHDRWAEWAGEYYAWAVAKHAFLTKPKKGDPDYPKLSDFFNDPSTPQNEAKDALEAAIAAINAISDPGSAPEEPRDLRPSVVQDSLVWQWNSSQGERDQENIDRCDPTKDTRQPPRPEPPDRDNYPDAEDWQEAQEAHKEAVKEWEQDQKELRARSKRQSEWRIVTPDEWSDWRGKPDTVPDLPENPTEEDRELHTRQKRRYEFLLNRWRNERHASLVVCDVRRVCGEPPEGAVEEWDLRFPTTELPPLSPGKEDPARWSEWYARFS